MFVTGHMLSIIRQYRNLRYSSFTENLNPRIIENISEARDAKVDQCNVYSDGGGANSY